MADIINLFGRGKIDTLSERKKKAYLFKDKCAEQIAMTALQNKIEPYDMVEPFAQYLATLIAMSNVTGHPVDLADITKKLPLEVTEMTKLMIGRIT